MTEKNFEKNRKKITLCGWFYRKGTEEWCVPRIITILKLVVQACGQTEIVLSQRV